MPIIGQRGTGERVIQNTGVTKRLKNRRNCLRETKFTVARSCKVKASAVPQRTQNERGALGFVHQQWLHSECALKRPTARTRQLAKSRSDANSRRIEQRTSSTVDLHRRVGLTRRHAGEAVIFEYCISPCGRLRIADAIAPCPTLSALFAERVGEHDANRNDRVNRLTTAHSSVACYCCTFAVPASPCQSPNPAM